MSRRAAWALLLILLVGAGLRLGRWSEERAGPLARAPLGDEATYDRWGQELARGDAPYQVPYQAPLPAYGLAALHALLPSSLARDAARLLSALLGLGTVALTFGCGRRVSGDARVGLLAAAVVALDRSLIYHEPTLLRDGPATFFLVLSAWVLIRLRALQEGEPRRMPELLTAAALGATLGVGALVRENLLLVGALALGALAWVGVRRAAPGTRRPRALALAAAGVALALPLAPWIAANAARAGSISPLPTWNGGCVFYIHNHRANRTATYLPPAFVNRHNAEGEEEAFEREAERRAGRPLTPHEVSSYWLREGAREVLAEPGLYARKVATRAWHLVISGVQAHARDLRLDAQGSAVLSLPSLGFGFLVPLAALGALFGPRRARPLALLALAAAATTLPIAFTTRYRLPLVPLLAVLAVLGAREAGRGLKVVTHLWSARWRPSRAGLARALSQRQRAGVRVALLGPALLVGLALHRQPGDYTPNGALFNRAVSHMILREPERARAALERIVEPSPLMNERIGELALRTGQPLLARRAYERALAADPQRHSAWAGVAAAHLQTGAREQGLEAIGEARALAPAVPVYQELERRLRALPDAPR